MNEWMNEYIILSFVSFSNLITKWTSKILVLVKYNFIQTFYVMQMVRRSYDDDDDYEYITIYRH